jgi:hypothetical protein
MQSQLLFRYTKEFTMPSKTPAQAKLMRAAAHTKGGFGGVPQKVGREFTMADKAKRPMKKKGGK